MSRHYSISYVALAILFVILGIVYLHQGHYIVGIIDIIIGLFEAKLSVKDEV